MDNTVKRLVDLIVKDEIESHTHAAKAQFRDWNLELQRRRTADSQERRKLKAPEPLYENYSSGRWTHEASILKVNAESFVRELGRLIRDKTTDPEAGLIFCEAAGGYLATLDGMYSKRFDDARKFYWGGRELSLPDYWAKERDALDRKIEIERLQFLTDAGDVAADEVKPAQVRKSPSKADLANWASNVGNVSRDKVTKAFINSTWAMTSPDVWPTIGEARTALDAKYGRRPRGRERNSNRK